MDGLAEQHARLKRDGDALVVALDDIVNGSITSREHVEAPGRAYIEAFRSHMDREEAEILPLAAKLLDREDWAAIDAAILLLDDPVFGKTRDQRYAALRRQIAREARGPVDPASWQRTRAPDGARSCGRSLGRGVRDALVAVDAGHRSGEDCSCIGRTKSFCFATMSLLN